MLHYIAEGFRVCSTDIPIDGRMGVNTAERLRGGAIYYDPDFEMCVLITGHDDKTELDARQLGKQYLGRVMAFVFDESTHELIADIAYTQHAKELIETGAFPGVSVFLGEMWRDKDKTTATKEVIPYVHHLALAPPGSLPAVPGLDKPEDLIRKTTRQMELTDIEEPRLRALLERKGETMQQPKKTPEGAPSGADVQAKKLQEKGGEGASESALVKTTKAAMPEILKAVGDAVDGSGDVGAAFDELKRALILIGAISEDAPAETGMEEIPPEPEVIDPSAMCDPSKTRMTAQIAELERRVEAGDISQMLLAESNAGFISAGEFKYFRDGYQGKKLTAEDVRKGVAALHVSRPTPPFAGGKRFDMGQVEESKLVKLCDLTTSAAWSSASDDVVVEYMRMQKLIAAGVTPTSEFIADTRAYNARKLLQSEQAKLLEGVK
ncbi:MAG: hypothetical protein WC359_12760 [Dehalococcoidia bacterium]